MFRPFQRLGDRDNTSGVGLGFALSRGLAESMGGTLEAEATPGGGLTMVLTLPRDERRHEGRKRGRMTRVLVVERRTPDPPRPADQSDRAPRRGGDGLLTEPDMGLPLPPRAGSGLPVQRRSVSQRSINAGSSTDGPEDINHDHTHRNRARCAPSDLKNTAREPTQDETTSHEFPCRTMNMKSYSYSYI